MAAELLESTDNHGIAACTACGNSLIIGKLINGHSS